MKTPQNTMQLIAGMNPAYGIGFHSSSKAFKEGQTFKLGDSLKLLNFKSNYCAECAS